MKALSESAPELYTEFMDGNFCVHWTSGAFNGIWTLAMSRPITELAKPLL